MVAPRRVGALVTRGRRHLRIVLGRRRRRLHPVHEETDPDYLSAAVDIFVSAAAHGRGVGSDAMRTLIAWLIDARGHHRLTVDPAAANARAIHVYEKLGFRPVGVLRQYERVAGGSWRDALLMELLADEFVRE